MINLVYQFDPVATKVIAEVGEATEGTAHPAAQS